MLVLGGNEPLKTQEANKAHLRNLRKGGNLIIALQNMMLVDGSKTINAVRFSYIYREKKITRRTTGARGYKF